MPGINALQIQEFMNFFTGSQHNYGEFLPDDKEPKKSKKGGKYRTVTNKLITIEEYRDHLEGRKGLGIIPIMDSGMCRFSAIDVDIYDEDLTMYVDAVERGNFPLIPFLSKSGGLHLYMFFKEDTPAGKAVEVMRKLSFLLAIDSLVKSKRNGTVEVFPKQTKVKQGEMGSFINIPYFNATESRQVALRSGKKLTLTEALVFIKEKRVGLTDAMTFLTELEYSDAPPCLQQVYLLDPFEKMSGRNNFLFSFGVYLKKKDEDFFEQRLSDVNNSMKEPLDDKELEKTILASLRKKDYVYKCKETPCADFCHKKECRNREFGIGKNEGYFSSVECGQLFQYKLDQPYYEWEVRLQGQEQYLRLRFRSEDEIIKQDAFLRLCMRELHELPSKLKQMEWFNKVNSALKEIVCVKVEQADDTSPYAMFTGLVTSFLTEQAMAETKEQIRTRKAYYDKQEGTYLFRGEDLQNFVINTKQFKHYQPNEFHWLYRQMGCEAKQIRIKGSTLRVWSLKKVDLDNFGKVVTYESFKPDFQQFAEEDY